MDLAREEFVEVITALRTDQRPDSRVWSISDVIRKHNETLTQQINIHEENKTLPGEVAVVDRSLEKMEVEITHTAKDKSAPQESPLIRKQPPYLTGNRGYVTCPRHEDSSRYLREFINTLSCKWWSPRGVRLIAQHPDLVAAHIECMECDDCNSMTDAALKQMNYDQEDDDEEDCYYVYNDDDDDDDDYDDDDDDFYDDDD